VTLGEPGCEEDETIDTGTAAALAAYRGARGELAQVLEAERVTTETELALVEALAERAKAWASLNYLYPQEQPR